MGKMYKLKDINFFTNLTPEKVKKIVNNYIKINKLEYRIIEDGNNILFDDCCSLLSEPIWLVEVRHIKTPPIWFDQTESIIVSDRTGIVKYRMNEHGVTFNL